MKRRNQSFANIEEPKNHTLGSLSSLLSQLSSVVLRTGHTTRHCKQESLSSVPCRFFFYFKTFHMAINQDNGVNEGISPSIRTVSHDGEKNGCQQSQDTFAQGMIKHISLRSKGISHNGIFCKHY